jgi:hypothetical protein
MKKLLMLGWMVGWMHVTAAESLFSSLSPFFVMFPYPIFLGVGERPLLVLHSLRVLLQFFFYDTSIGIGLHVAMGFLISC